ncbi:venom peptide La1-like [Dermacentor variabilis]|uniref:venom peptide La1-like n=1 Tax=Dermacentor variabilis TaxID=34621 RepID=UPI003F5BDB77
MDAMSGTVETASLTLLLSLAVFAQASYFNPVPLVNGSCIINATEVPLGSSVDLGNPCVSLYCNGLNQTAGDLVIIACVSVAARPPLKVVPGGAGTFPDCCPKLVRDETFPTPWYA